MKLKRSFGLERRSVNFILKVISLLIALIFISEIAFYLMPLVDHWSGTLFLFVWDCFLVIFSLELSSF